MCAASIAHCPVVCMSQQAYRLQNATQWNLYRTRREAIALQHEQSVARTASPNNVETLPLKSILEFYGSESSKLAQHGLMQEANETYLFHGTRVRCLSASQYIPNKSIVDSVDRASSPVGVEFVVCSLSSIFCTSSHVFHRSLVCLRRRSSN